MQQHGIINSVFTLTIQTLGEARVKKSESFVLFDLIFYLPSTIFQLIKQEQVFLG